MATLKDLIRAETLKVGSHGAMPSTQVIKLIEKRDFVCPTGTESFNYIAPCDGVLVAFLQAGSRDGNNQPGVNIVADNDIRYAIRTTDGSVQMQLRKGETSRADFYEAHQNVAQWIVRFVKTIGGGDKRYLKALACNRFGGSLWLRLKTTSEILRKEARTLASWRISQLASTTRPLLGSGQIQSLHPTTVSLQSSGKVLGWFSYLHSTLGSKVYRQREYQLHTSLLKRGRDLTTSFNLRGKFPFVDSYQFSLASNNARMEVAA